MGLAALGGAAYGVDGALGPARARRHDAAHRTARRGAKAKTRATDAVEQVTLEGGVSAPSAPWLVEENLRPGTLDWVVSATTQIYGYSDHVSAVSGDVVTLYVDPPAVPYTVELYRMGYYGGLGGRHVWSSPVLSGSASQPRPTTDPVTFMVECQWQPTLRVGIDDAWPPGAYLFKLTGSDNGLTAGYIPLCIRDDTSTAAFAVQQSVTTWQAYNAWGGRSLYVGPGDGATGEGGGADRSRVVSFDRPYDSRGWGAPDFLGNEFPLIYMVESLGLDATYFTDLDLHQDPTRLLRHRCLFSLGHDEYWSSAMRDGAATALGRGTNFAFLGANAIYRHVRFEDSPLGPDRHQVCYKTDLAREDPLWGSDPAEVTANWPDPPVPRPEQQVIGSQYADVAALADMVVADAGAWVFVGTGVSDGEHLHLVVEGEYDHYEPGLTGSPQNVTILAHSPVPNRGPGRYSDMTYYTAPGGGGVLATGTASFVSRLSHAPRIYANTVHPAFAGVTPVLWRMMANVFSVFGSGPASASQPSTGNWQGLV
ncbi:MAG: N,N-dimethylformamidase beta subunit family domain-containing protein [Acidimicrobiales bacterium]